MASSIPFPFAPYSSQSDLMQRIFGLIDSSDDSSGRQWAKVGIFESPTGTGKSLSLLCASLHWLLNHRTQHQSAAATPVHRDELDWIREFAEKTSNEEHETEERQRKLIEETRMRLAMTVKARSATPRLPSHKRTIAEQRIEERHPKQLVDDGDDFDLLVSCDISNECLVVDADDGESLPEWKRILAAETRAKRAAVAEAREERIDDELASELHVKTQIIICSRTHSQLSQLVNEIRKTVFADRVRVLTLGSRAQMCQHPAVQSIKSTQRMNDACIDMQSALSKQRTSMKAKQARTAASRGPCPFLADPQAQRLFRQFALTSIHDVEELATLGSRLSSCSYYGARSLIDSVHILAMPYQSLLATSTRESLGVDDTRLRQSIVIFDEAHNLVEAINDLHSFSLTQSTLAITYQRLSDYENKFRSRLKPANLEFIQQLARLAHAAAAMIEGFTGDQPRLLTMSEFVCAASLDAINLFHLHAFVRASELHKKIGGFVERYVADEDGAASTRVSSCIHELDALIVALSNRNADGRIVLERDRLRFLLLNASVAMRPIIKQARAVLLIGGTMQPFHHHRSQLMQELPDQLLTTFACDHVIDPSHVTAVTMPKGPTGQTLEFNFINRNDPAVLDELSRCLINLCAIVPKGLVVFFPSHAMLAVSLQRFRENGAFARIDAKKRIFLEAPGESVDTLLADYSSHVTAAGAASMFAVVGGRLSEGINFSDDLCRCVCLVGLPYANPHELELKARMKFVEDRRVGAGAAYYESLCMRAVNQSIGRAIRHAKDYAAIVLLDQRFNVPSIQQALPAWIRKRSQCSAAFPQAFRVLKQFFDAIPILQQPVSVHTATGQHSTISTAAN